MSFVGLVFSPITCLLWIFVGAIAGGLAHQFVGSGRSQGFVSDMVLGLIGAVIGGFILSFFGVQFRGSVWNPIMCCGHLFVATFGASVLIVLGRVLSGNRV
ncbi:MAG: GlsB/YeaQ/YmgE family stress response membrane protein [Chloroflexota bacterium]